MKKLLFITLLFCLFAAGNSYAKTPLRILFLGNSYTYVNDLPGMFAQAAISAGDSVSVTSYTAGGKRFMDFVSDAATNTYLNQDKWDYVVLQGQSQETSWAENQLSTEVYPFAAALCNAARQANSCTTPLFYMTWGRKFGDAQNSSVLPYLATYAGMDSAVRRTYLYLGKVNEAAVSPVGAVWSHIITMKAYFDLYSTDASHPSMYGTYAAACTFYTSIFKKSPDYIKFIPEGVDSSAAAMIKSAVKTVVLDSLDYWNFTRNNASAVFTQEIDKKTVNFSSAGSVFDSLRWDFGDGNSSNEENPSHEYANFGKYRVTLTSFLCKNSAVHTAEIVLTDLSDVKDSPVPGITPNPAGAFIDAENFPVGAAYSLFSDSGSKIKSGKFSSAKERIDIAQLPAGIYFLKTGSLTYKIVKIK